MYKEIELLTVDGAKKFAFSANGATSIRYKNIFHEDLNVKAQKYATFIKGESAGEDADSSIFAKLAYVMNASGDKKDMGTLSAEGFMDWLEQFEADALDVAANDIYAVYAATQQTSSEGKKK